MEGKILVEHCVLQLVFHQGQTLVEHRILQLFPLQGKNLNGNRVFQFVFPQENTLVEYRILQLVLLAVCQDQQGFACGFCKLGNQGVLCVIIVSSM